MAEVCRGCRLVIDGEPHFHVGAKIQGGSDGRAYAFQDPAEREPSVAIIFRLGQGDLTVMMPEGFPDEAAMPVIQMIRDQYQYNPLNSVVINQMFDEARMAFKAAMDNGSIVRDYLGKWHVAGRE